MPEGLLSLMAFMMLTAVLVTLRTYRYVRFFVGVWLAKLASMGILFAIRLPGLDISLSMGINMFEVMVGCVLIACHPVGFPSWLTRRESPVWISRAPR